jgi:hypothetical protein
MLRGSGDGDAILVRRPFGDDADDGEQFRPGD